MNTLHIEIAQKAASTLNKDAVKEMVISSSKPFFGANDCQDQYQRFDGSSLEGRLSDHVEFLDVDCANPSLQEDVRVHVYKMHDYSCQTEDIDSDEGSIHAASHYILPSRELDGQWENLVFEDDVKNILLKYVETALILSDHGVNPNIVSWNRVILLHGPPGTGKTSLCKALAHKLSIRQADRFKYGQLVEINSHSLFSKWFSESGKLVQKMFEQILELVEDPQVLVCVLIDEVESLSAARNGNGNEPSDALRVVNALLTQIDGLKRHRNVLVLTTSNITGAIDVAFVDRADIKHFVGLPACSAIYSMLRSSALELMDKGLIQWDNILTFNCLPPYSNIDGGDNTNNSATLLDIANNSPAPSARFIRKLPFLALAKLSQFPVTLHDFLAAIRECLVQNSTTTVAFKG